MVVRRRVSRLRAAVLVALVAASVSAAPAADAAGGVVPRADRRAPTALHVETALASTPSGTTRWSRLTVENDGSPVLWLVPARPGAALDLAGDRFLDALDEASRPRILAPLTPPPAGCLSAYGAELPAWGLPRGALATTSNVTVLGSEPEARAHVAARGFAVDAATADRLVSVYRGGFQLVAVEVAGRSGAKTSPTLRVSDVGSSVLPFALTGSAGAETTFTAFTLGAGVASVPTATVVEAPLVRHEDGASDYVAQRASAIAGGARVVRESAGDTLLFVGAGEGNVSTPSVVDALFDATCASAARSASLAPGALERVCAPGQLGFVPGGIPCEPRSGGLSAASYRCRGTDDLALALSEQWPSSVALTRFVGVVPEARLGADLPVSFDASRAEQSPVSRAGAWACTGTPSSPPSTTVVTTPSAEQDVVVTHESCSGSSTVVYVEEEEPPPPSSDACGGSTTTTTYEDDGSSSSSSDSCGGSSSSSSSSSSGDDGWDSSDDDGGGCGGSSSSSSSTSSSSGDDGWDTSDSSDSSSDSCGGGSSSAAHAAVAKAAKPTRLAHGPKKRGPSPLSRVAVVAAALLLPLRRRLRGRSEAFRA